MTKSSKPKDKLLKKQSPSGRADTPASGSPALDSGFQSADTDAKCMITFQTILQLEHTEQIDRNTPLTFAPDPQDPKNIVLFQNGRMYGNYFGSNISTLLTCMNSGYIYRARIVDIQPAGVTVEVRGQGA